MAEAPRSRAQRIEDVRARFERDVDVWVATADPAGEPHLVVLSFLWRDGVLILSTEERMQTMRNLRRNGSVRLGFGLTRDVVMVDGAVERFVPSSDVEAELGDAFAAKAGFDPRTFESVYAFVRPSSVRAWREENELAGRLVMKDGLWLD